MKQQKWRSIIITPELEGGAYIHDGWKILEDGFSYLEFAGIRQRIDWPIEEVSTDPRICLFANYNANVLWKPGTVGFKIDGICKEYNFGIGYILQASNGLLEPFSGRFDSIVKRVHFARYGAIVLGKV